MHCVASLVASPRGGKFGYPEAMSVSSASAELIQDLVDANHILHHQGHRRRVRPCQRASRCRRGTLSAGAQHARRRACRRARHREYDVASGEALTPNPPKPYLERFIHSEIYRARPM